jgi:hypothetical protein
MQALSCGLQRSVTFPSLVIALLIAHRIEHGIVYRNIHVRLRTFGCCCRNRYSAGDGNDDGQTTDRGMEREMKINACPFCQSKDVIVHKASIGFDYSVGCNSCDALGPSEQEAKFAVKSWNKGTPRWSKVFELEAKLAELNKKLNTELNTK